MTFKDTLINEMKDKNRLNELRYRASKITFILVALLFFTSFFLTGAWLFQEFLLKIYWTLYIMFLFSFFMYCYFLTKKLLASKPKAILYSVVAVLIVFLLTLALPVLIEWGIFWLFK
jgi:hypothetical protein